MMDASQAMALYGRLVTALEAGLSAVVAQAGPQRAPALNLAMLGPDHEVCRLVRQSAEVAAQIVATEREAAVFQFARTVFFKKVAEQSSRPEEVCHNLILILYMCGNGSRYPASVSFPNSSFSSLPSPSLCLRFVRHTPKRTLSQASLLRVEAYVGVLGLLKSECPKLVQDCLGWVAYLPVNDEADCKLHRTILVRTRSKDRVRVVMVSYVSRS